MPVWKRYTWDDFEPDALARIERLADARKERTAREEDFDPAHTFAAELDRDWNGHPRGSRVMFDAEGLAIEIPARLTRSAESNS
jgi:hypothetical protein